MKNNGGFCEELLSKNNFEAVLVNFCCYKYGANASEAKEFKRLAEGRCWSYANSLKQLILKLQL